MIETLDLAANDNTQEPSREPLFDVDALIVQKIESAAVAKSAEFYDRAGVERELGPDTFRLYSSVLRQEQVALLLSLESPEYIDKLANSLEGEIDLSPNEQMQKYSLDCAREAMRYLMTRIIEHKYIARDFAGNEAMLQKLLVEDTEEIMPIVMSYVRDALLQAMRSTKLSE